MGVELLTSAERQVSRQQGGNRATSNNSSSRSCQTAVAARDLSHSPSSC